MTSANMVQDDIWRTHLPNGMLRWFGFDFDRVELPGEPLLKGEEPPTWVGTPPLFTLATRVSDATVIIQAQGLYAQEEDETTAPERYTLTVSAHRVTQEHLEYPDWPQVQQACRRMERELDESHPERHAHCVDEEGDLSPDACLYCERGVNR